MSARPETFGWGLAARQRGFSLMETMIALSLSMVVTSAMVMLMGNSMGAASRIIEMSQLTDELRNAMRMMSRDVRRANFSANSIYCYGNSDCGSDGSASQYADIAITDGDCFIYGLDRNWDGNAASDDAGGFRRVTANGVGVIEIWVGGAAPVCSGTSEDWLAVTDPNVVDVTSFNVDDGLSSSASVAGGSGSTLTKRTREIQMQLEGRLVIDHKITRRIEDRITVRNDFMSQT